MIKVHVTIFCRYDPLTGTAVSDTDLKLIPNHNLRAIIEALDRTVGLSEETYAAGKSPP